MNVVDRARLVGGVHGKVEGTVLAQRVEGERLSPHQRRVVRLAGPPGELDLVAVGRLARQGVASQDVRLNEEDSSTVEVSARTATRAVGLVERHELVDES